MESCDVLADMLKKLVARFEAKNGNSGERAQITTTTYERRENVPQLH